jgi:hypothetical protein
MKFHVIFLLLFFPFTTALSFSGNGSGTEADPYQITNVHQLQEMNDDLDAHYILMNDIDASETRGWNVGDHDNDPETPDSAMGFEPVGECFNATSNDPMYKGPFTGSLDGRGFRVSYLYIDRPKENCIGLFGCISDGGYVYDTSIENARVRGEMFVGVFVGRAFAAYKNISFENCNGGGSASGYKHVGGFCGSCEGVNIYSCSSSGSVGNNIDFFDVSSVGGFCGRLISDNNYNKISLCQSFCTVFGSGVLGGFCGSLILSSDSDCSIDLCISKGNVYGDTTSISFTTPNSVGGFIGFISSFAESNSSLIIKNCYSEGSSSIRKFCGGFCGHIANLNSIINIENCYSIGRVFGESAKRGGFCVTDYTASEKIKIISSYWDTQTSEIDSSDGGTGKTTAEMMMQSTFVDWDFDEVWCIDEGNDYPKLRVFGDCPPVGVEDISEVESLNAYVYPNPAKDFINISIKNEIPSSLKIEIYDSMGNKLKKVIDSPYFSGESYKNTIDISDLSSGVYHIRIVIGNRIISQKINVIR